MARSNDGVVVPFGADIAEIKAKLTQLVAGFGNVDKAVAALVATLAKASNRLDDLSKKQDENSKKTQEGAAAWGNFGARLGGTLAGVVSMSAAIAAVTRELTDANEQTRQFVENMRGLESSSKLLLQVSPDPGQFQQRRQKAGELSVKYGLRGGLDQGQRLLTEVVNARVEDQADDIAATARFTDRPELMATSYARAISTYGRDKVGSFNQFMSMGVRAAEYSSASPETLLDEAGAMMAYAKEAGSPLEETLAAHAALSFALGPAQAATAIKNWYAQTLRPQMVPRPISAKEARALARAGQNPSRKTSFNPATGRLEHQWFIDEEIRLRGQGIEERMKEGEARMGAHLPPDLRLQIESMSDADARLFMEGNAISNFDQELQGEIRAYTANILMRRHMAKIREYRGIIAAERGSQAALQGIMEQALADPQLASSTEAQRMKNALEIELLGDAPQNSRYVAALDQRRAKRSAKIADAGRLDARIGYALLSGWLRAHEWVGELAGGPRGALQFGDVAGFSNDLERAELGGQAAGSMNDPTVLGVLNNIYAEMKRTANNTQKGPTLRSPELDKAPVGRGEAGSSPARRGSSSWDSEGF